MDRDGFRYGTIGARHTEMSAQIAPDPKFTLLHFISPNSFHKIYLSAIERAESALRRVVATWRFHSGRVHVRPVD